MLFGLSIKKYDQDQNNVKAKGKRTPQKIIEPVI